MLWSGDTMKKFSRELDRSALRQQVISHNLANLNTPGYKRSYVPFSQELDRARSQEQLTRTHQQHIEGGRAQDPRVVTENWTSRRADGNNVDLDKEMIDMVTNQLRYNTLVQQLNERFATWRNIINEGRG